MIELKKIYTKIFIFTISIIVFIIGIFLSSKFIKANNVFSNYIYTGNIDYSVSLKDGSINNQKLFVSSLVNNINVKFNYKYSLDKSDNVKYKYDIVASVISNLDDSNEDVTEVNKKDFILLNTNYKQIENNNIDINKSIDLNYDYYNNIAVDYDNSVNIPIKSKLMVKLNLYIEYNNEEKIYTSYLSLPLEKTTFSITTKEGRENGEIYSKDKNDKKLLVNILFSLIIMVFIILIIYETIKITNYKKKNILEFKYRKIMKDYDNIVVPINKIPKDNDIVTVKVLYFKSMIDIQKELHVPILCYKSNEFVVYMIINNKLAYVYFLNEEHEKI